MRQRVGNILFGLAFLVAGLGFGGQALGLRNFNLFFSGWWTLFLIVPCFISLIRDGLGFWNLGGLVIGVLLLLSAQGLVNGRVIGRLIFPLILVLIGLQIIFGGMFRRQSTGHVRQDGQVEYSAVFSGNRASLYHEEFTGANVTAVFGGVTLDLRGATMTEDRVINSSAIFGGVDIFAPEGVKVKVSSVPVFGGTSNKTLPPSDPNAPTLFVNSVCIFGGADIK